MLKIGKGLKKKKKSKKNKHKDDELFTEEELEQYRREHQQKAAQESENTEEKSGETSEELQKFKLLTAGVDDVLRETQGRLDRIKKDSFFQRKPTPSDLKAQEEKERELQKQTKGNWIGFEEGKEDTEKQEEENQEEQQEESESEYEFDENDDLFDTTYVDAIASGEVKLAYVPDDDEENEVDQGFDPFDTSTAEEILKKVEEEEKKKKKQISLGVAVEVLTGRAERDKSLLQETGLLDTKAEGSTQVNKPRKRPRKIQDFSLLGSFDDNSNLTDEVPTKEENKTGSESIREGSQPRSLLDDDLTVECDLPEGDVLITEILVKQSTAKKETTPTEETEVKETKSENLETLLNEFDTVKEGSSYEVRKLEEEDDFDEFTALAASSVANQKLEEELNIYEDLENDPFDTSVVNNILREEKKDDIFGTIEGEIPPTETIPYTLTERNWSAFEKEDQEPADPFDTTFVDNVQPGKCELKLLENEILGDIVSSVQKSDIHLEARILSRSNSDFDFNPREEEIKTITEPVLNIVHSKVSIQITDPSGVVESQRSSVSESTEGTFRQLTHQHRDLLGGSTSDLSKLGDEPLPPNVESPVEDFSKYSDPFDTSIVDQVVVPGKAELKFIEKELLSDIHTSDTGALSDDEFDPRAEEKSVPRVTFDIPPEVQSDLLSSVREEGARPLTPYYSDSIGEDGAEEAEEFDYSDPFDTSHVISLPGKVEIKLIEKELESIENTQTVIVPLHKKLGILEPENPNISSGIKHSLSDQDFNPREEENFGEGSVPNRRYSDATGFVQKPPSLPLKQKDKLDLLLVEEELPVKALTPAVEQDISSYIDPFDTSIAENIAPGKAELKVLEKELIEPGGSIKRSYTDPDFNPRGDNNESSKPDISDVLGLPENSERTAKPLTPSETEKPDVFDDTDPFDTSIAANLVPGKAELRVLESELFGQ